MTSIPSTGPVSFSAIRNMLGVTTNNMNSFRIASGTYTPNTNIPTGVNTTISADIFHGKTRAGCPQWSTRLGTATNDNIYGAKVDINGDIIICGTYNGVTCTFYNQPGTVAGATLAQIGSGDIFVVKYSAAGSVIWAARAGSTSNDTGFTMDLDSSGNIYVGGGFLGTMNIYNASGTLGGSVTAVGTGVSVYIIKYNSSGVFQWVLRCGSTGAIVTQLYGIGVDSTGSVVAAGIMAGACRIYNSSAAGSALSATLAQIGGVDVWIAKWNSTGTRQWSTRCGSSGADSTPINRISFDSSDNVFINMTYAAALSVYNAAGTLWGSVSLVSNAPDGCLIKYNSTGAVVWALKEGSANDSIAGTAVDKVNNWTYWAFSGANPTFIYNSTGATISRAGGAYIVKYDSAGALLWVVRMWTTSSTLINHISMTSDNKIVVYGVFSGGTTLTFYNAANVAVGTQPSAAYTQFFIAKYDSAGSLEYSTTITSTAALGLTANIDGNSGTTQVVIGGYSATGLPTFRNPSGTAQSSQTSIGQNDMFLCRYVF
jgi:hypothetical protein